MVENGSDDQRGNDAPQGACASILIRTAGRSYQRT
jgi:hypothetical protein